MQGRHPRNRACLWGSIRDRVSERWRAMGLGTGAATLPAGVTAPLRAFAASRTAKVLNRFIVVDLVGCERQLGRPARTYVPPDLRIESTVSVSNLCCCIGIRPRSRRPILVRATRAARFPVTSVRFDESITISHGRASCEASLRSRTVT